MSAYVQKGKAVYISSLPQPVAVAITAATKANPCVLTVVNTAAVGDYVRVEGSGMATLDGRAFEITAVSGTSATITADTSGEAAAATTGSAYFYPQADLVETCFSSFGFTREAAATITAGTFCSTTTLRGQDGANTIEFAGYDDPEGEGENELIAAQLDGQPRLLVYNYPTSASATGKAYKLILPAVTISGLNSPIATADGAATFSGTGISNGVPTYTQLVN